MITHGSQARTNSNYARVTNARELRFDHGWRASPTRAYASIKNLTVLIILSYPVRITGESLNILANSSSVKVSQSSFRILFRSSLTVKAGSLFGIANLL